MYLMLLMFKLILLVSMIFVFWLSKWFFVWVLLELSTLALIFLLSSQYSSRSVEATTKYFLVQAVAGVIMLFGILVRFVGSKDFGIFSSYSGFSYFLMQLGMFMKLAVFPNPFWFVDVVSGISLFRGFYVVVLSKVVPMYLYVLIMSEYYMKGFMLIGLVSVFFGSVFGVKQVNVRKIMSLSSMAHLGWMMISFPFLSIFICLVLFLLYVVMVLPIFWLSVLNNYEGLGKLKKVNHNLLVGLIMLLSVLSLAGFPPLVGFFYKWIMFSGLVTKNLYLVSGLLILFSLVSLYFYLQICFNLYSLYFTQKGLFLNYLMLGKSGLQAKMFLGVLFVSIIFLIGPLGVMSLI